MCSLLGGSGTSDHVEFFLEGHRIQPSQQLACRFGFASACLVEVGSYCVKSIVRTRQGLAKSNLDLVVIG